MPELPNQSDPTLSAATSPASTPIDQITPTQCRAARALLEITQTELGDAAKLGLSTVVDFEKGRRQVSSLAIEAIRNALATAGIEFIDENGGGPGVRLQKRISKRSK